MLDKDHLYSESGNGDSGEDPNVLKQILNNKENIDRTFGSGFQEIITEPVFQNQAYELRLKMILDNENKDRDFFIFDLKMVGQVNDITLLVSAIKSIDSYRTEWNLRQDASNFHFALETSKTETGGFDLTLQFGAIGVMSKMLKDIYADDYIILSHEKGIENMLMSLLLKANKVGDMPVIKAEGLTYERLFTQARNAIEEWKKKKIEH